MEFIKATKNGLNCGGKLLLLRGFGLGGWFLPEGYMWKLYTKCDRPRRLEKMIRDLCGDDYAEYFWNEYFNNYITEKDIALIAAEGFNSVRLPLNARHLYEKHNGQLQFIPDTILRVDQLITWCRKYNVYVILDMHGAPGGQTGQNIDDSENDEPLLFIEKQYEQQLIAGWKMLAERYAKEETVAGYDLLNEPLPNWVNQYNDKVLPLYRKLISEIRKVDQNHMIILEGVHWATDFTIFDDFTIEEASDNILLQFHKYWSNPDEESLEAYLDTAKRLNVPLFMGEGGENNCDWYTTIFPTYERLNISWSFWSYKKMECNNSPVTFQIPEGWNELIDWIDGTKDLESEQAKKIFDDLLACISNVSINKKVFCSLKRQIPVTIPCEAYDDYIIASKRIPGAALRTSDPVTLLFESGKTGEVDYKRYDGSEQPKDENILVQLMEQDSVSYEFINKETKVTAEVAVMGSGTLLFQIDQEVISLKVEGTEACIFIVNCDTSKKHRLNLKCVAGIIQLDTINLS